MIGIRQLNCSLVFTWKSPFLYIETIADSHQPFGIDFFSILIPAVLLPPILTHFQRLWRKRRHSAWSSLLSFFSRVHFLTDLLCLGLGIYPDCFACIHKLEFRCGDRPNRLLAYVLCPKLPRMNPMAKVFHSDLAYTWLVRTSTSKQSANVATIVDSPILFRFFVLPYPQLLMVTWRVRGLHIPLYVASGRTDLRAPNKVTEFKDIHNSWGVRGARGALRGSCCWV